MFFTCVCDSVHGGGGWMVSQHALQVSIPACLAAGLRRRGWYLSMPCRFPGPHPRGKLRSLARGGLKAHTWGSPGPHPGGCLLWGGACSRGVCSGCVCVETSHNSYCCGWYASYWNAFLLSFDLTLPVNLNVVSYHELGEIYCKLFRNLFQYTWLHISYWK